MSERWFRPGEDIRVLSRVPHTWRAETQSSLVVELRPALRTWEFWRELFGVPTDRRGNPRIGEFARLMLAYPDESPYFRPIPPPVQKALAVLLSNSRPLHARSGSRLGRV
ncbi:MAG: hypothetical protein ACTHQQ_10995 [Solirubrobacteraceae bacterium]